VSIPVHFCIKIYKAQHNICVAQSISVYIPDLRMTPKGQILSEAIVTVREALSFARIKGLSFMEEEEDGAIKCYW